MNENVLDTGAQAPGSQSRPTVLYTWLGIFFGILFPIVASIVKVLGLGLPLSLASLVHVQSTEPLLWITDTAPFFLGVVANIAGRRQELVAQANRELLQRDAELRKVRANLEEGVMDRTRELDERNAEMRSVVAFARQLADIQDMQALLSSAVSTISQRFGRYAVNLYVLDETGHTANLRASSSPSGQQLLKEGFRASVGDQSLVGRAAQRGRLLIAPARPVAPESTTQAGPATAPNAQIALPLVVRGKVIGVLEMLCKEPAAISQSESEMFQLLADQLATSIDNARLVSEARTAMGELESLAAKGTQAAWRQFLKNSNLRYQFTPASGVKPAPPGGGAEGPNSLSIPIVLRGQEIGAIRVQQKSGNRWSSVERELLDKVAAQVALAVENARLLEETRQRATQEQIVSEVSARFSRSLDVDALLQAAAREFAALPEVAEATVLLGSTEEQGQRGQ